MTSVVYPPPSHSTVTGLSPQFWSSRMVFSSFYLRDVQHEYDGLLSLGPFVAAGFGIG